MKILYMNQGVNGGWGAIKYSGYDIICLAESDQAKSTFDLAWRSTDSDPVMSLQQKEGKRTIINPTDIDTLCGTVRPIVTFKLRGSPVRVVFMHLKSGNEKFASEALTIAAEEVRNLIQYSAPNTPVLWIGDFNRATPGTLNNIFNDAKCLHEGGGHAKWNLDRVYITGGWKSQPKVSVVSTSTADHGHQGVSVEF